MCHSVARTSRSWARLQKFNPLKSQLALTLFVLRVFAQHPHHALAANNLAFVANLFD
jgi:hypothetical protein